MTGGAPGQPWPVARAGHTGVSLHEADGRAIDPALLVMCGYNGGTLSDGWIFTVNSQQWRKVGDYFEHTLSFCLNVTGKIAWAAITSVKRE